MAPKMSQDEECQEDGNDTRTAQEEADFKMALALQQQEKEEAFVARNRLASSNRRGSNAMYPSTTFFSPSAKVAKHDQQSPFEYKKMELTQEEKDRRLAIQLQEQEEKELKRRRSPKPSRPPMSISYTTSAFGLPSSLVSWAKAKGDAGYGTQENPQQQLQKPGVHFKDVPLEDGKPIVPPAQDYNRDIVYSPIDMSGDAEKANSVTQSQVTSNQEIQNSGVLSQFTHNILGSMGSWDTSTVVCSPETTNEDAPIHRARTGHDPSPNPSKKEHEMEGQEVQLMDVRDESSMPPPDPRVQFDWSNRVGSCHVWLPDSAASLFGNSQQEQRRYSSTGISSVNSLEMDGSNGDHLSRTGYSLDMDGSNGEHLSRTGSVGGGSLCQVFDEDTDDIINKAIKEVPSWERRMRSNSPSLSLGSMDEDDSTSLIRVRLQEKVPQTLTPIQDEDSMDMEWEGPRE